MANEVRLIDANALHKMLEEAQDGTRRIYFSLVDYGDKDVCKGELGTYARVKRMVEEAPTIDPESLRPKGRWGINRENEISKTVYCTNCWNDFYIRKKGELQLDMMPYCPNCGAKMEG